MTKSTTPKRKATVYTAKPIPLIGFVLLPSILAIYPVGRTAWHLGVKEGRYPQPVKLGPRKVAWRAEDIRALIAKAEAGEAP
jgi:predicted DNA-binding transcriptional regulator AlpA